MVEHGRILPRGRGGQACDQSGNKWVFVNGTVVVEEGKHQNVFPGHVLRKKCH